MSERDFLTTENTEITEASVSSVLSVVNIPWGAHE